MWEPISVEGSTNRLRKILFVKMLKQQSGQAQENRKNLEGEIRMCESIPKPKNQKQENSYLLEELWSKAPAAK
jgi:hypothetical protein